MSSIYTLNILSFVCQEKYGCVQYMNTIKNTEKANENGEMHTNLDIIQKLRD